MQEGTFSKYYLVLNIAMPGMQCRAVLIDDVNGSLVVNIEAGGIFKGKTEIRENKSKGSKPSWWQE